MNNTVMYKEILETPERILNCSKYNEQAIKDIASAIQNFKPSNIMIAARGTSLHAAMYAKYILELYYHIPVSLASKSVFTVYDNNIDLSKTLVIAISQSGKGKDITRVVEKARNSGALTVAITNELESSTYNASEYNLYCNVNKAVAYAATKTYTSTMYLITRLVYEITKSKEPLIDDKEIFFALHKGFNHLDKIKNLTYDYKDTTDMFTLGRGIYYSLAMELGLKIKETCHFHVSTYPASEFYHGPIIMVNENTPTLFIAIDKVTNNDIKNVIEKVKSLGSKTFVITNAQDVLATADKGIYINEQNSLYAMFEAIIILQLFVCELAVLRGQNPDFMEVLHGLETF